MKINLLFKVLGLLIVFVLFSTPIHAQSIQGFVTNSNGDGIGDVTITLTGATSANTTTISPQGYYIFSFASYGGSYTITAAKTDYIFVPDNIYIPSFTADLDNQNFLAVAQGYISGNVISAIDGTVLGGSLIEILKGTSVLYSVVCDSSGFFSVKLPADSYDVRASSSNYMTDIKISQLVIYNSTSTIDFILTVPGRLAGIVRASLDGAVIQGASVEILKDGVVKYKTTTNDVGFYIVKVTTDTYDIRVMSPLYFDATSTNITSLPNATVTTDFYLLSAGFISGKVTNPGGSPIQGISIEISKDGNVLYTAVSDVNGNYSIKVAIDTYDINFFSPLYLTETRTGISVSDNTTVTLNISLSEQGFIAGKIISTYNNTFNDEFNTFDNSKWEVLGSTWILINGRLSGQGTGGIDALMLEKQPAGGNYKIDTVLNIQDNSGGLVYRGQDWANLYLVEIVPYPSNNYNSLRLNKRINNTWYAWNGSSWTTNLGVRGISVSNPIDSNYRIGLNKNYLLEVEVINASHRFSLSDVSGGSPLSLNLNGSPNYTITDNDNNFLAGRVGFRASPAEHMDIDSITILPNPNIEGATIEVLKNGTAVYTATSDSSGDFSLRVLAGTYDLRVLSSIYVEDSKTNLSVLFNATTTANFTLLSAGFIAGNIKSISDNSNLPGIVVEVLKNGAVKYTAATDNSGNFSLRVIEDIYDIRTFSNSYVENIKSGILVQFNTTTTVNFSLESAGFIAGKVTSMFDDSAVPDAAIRIIKGTNTVVYISTADASGNFSIKLTTGVYSMEIYSPAHMPDLKTNITVLSNEITTVNINLYKAGFISGKVTSAKSNLSLSNALVQVFKEFNITYLINCTDPGIFSINVVTTTVLVYTVNLDTTSGVYTLKVDTNTPITYTVTDINSNTFLIKVTTATTQVIAAKSDALGNYSVKVATDTYLIKVSLKWYVAQSASNIIVNYSAQTPVDFALTEIQQNCMISGFIKDTKSVPLPSVTVELTGNTNLTVFTDNNGYYSFPNISGDEIYIIKPRKSNYNFIPANYIIYLIADIVKNFTFVYVSTGSPQKIEIPIGIGGKPVTVEMPAPSQAKIVVEELPDKPAGKRGTINPDRGEGAGIVFKPARNPQEYIGQKFTIRIFTLMGELVTSFDKIPQVADDTWIKWIPVNIASGIYLVSVEGPGVKVVKKVAIVR